MKSFEGQRGATLIVRPGELCGGDASASVDFRLTNLEDCTVLLYVMKPRVRLPPAAHASFVLCMPGLDGGPAAGSTSHAPCTSTN